MWNGRPVGTWRLWGDYFLRFGLAETFGTRAKSLRSESVKPGSTSPPVSVSPSVNVVETSGAVNTSMVRVLGSTCHTSRVPARKYSFRLRIISPRVLRRLSTSTATSGYIFGIGASGYSFVGSWVHD